VSNVKSQTKKEIEEKMRILMDEQCKNMLPFLITEEDLKSRNITGDCFCSANTEAVIKVMLKLDVDNMTLEEQYKAIQDMMDVNSVIHNEYIHNLSTLLETMCTGFLPASSISVNGPQKGTVALTKYGVMYRIKITMGNSSKYFTMDTGAENSFISKSYARELEDMDMIQPNDYIEPAEYRDAHGNTVLHKRVMLNSVKIGDFTLNNVIFAISNSNSGDFLLGKDILNAFQSWNINNSNSTLELIR
jgi:predicted aspartyl protease